MSPTFDNCNLVICTKTQESRNGFSECYESPDRLFKVWNFRLKHLLPSVCIDSSHLKNVVVFLLRQRIQLTKDLLLQEVLFLTNRILVPCFNRKSLKIVLLPWLQQCCNYAWKSSVEGRQIKRPNYHNCMECFIEAITWVFVSSGCPIIYSKKWSPI